jgi:predicted transcriptional regulator
MSETDEDAFLSLQLDADLLARLGAYAQADRRAVGAVVEDALEEYLGAHPSHEQTLAAGRAAMREYEAEYGPFTEEECAAAHAWVDEILAPRGDGYGAQPSEEDR